MLNKEANDSNGTSYQNGTGFSSALVGTLQVVQCWNSLVCSRNPSSTKVCSKHILVDIDEHLAYQLLSEFWNFIIVNKLLQHAPGKSKELGSCSDFLKSLLSSYSTITWTKDYACDLNFTEWNCSLALVLDYTILSALAEIKRNS